MTYRNQTKQEAEVWMPQAPLDFLGRELEVGNYICYPTGGTSCRMVLAKIVAIKDTIADWVLYDSYAHTSHPYGEKYEYWYWTGGTDNGNLGPARYKLSVNRIKEGSHNNDPNEDQWWHVDSTKKVTIDQLHRVMRVEESDLTESLKLN